MPRLPGCCHLHDNRVRARRRSERVVSSSETKSPRPHRGRAPGHRRWNSSGKAADIAGGPCPGPGPAVLFAPQPRCVPQLGALSPDAASGPSNVSTPAGPQMAQALPENRRAVDQGLFDKTATDAREDVCKTFPRGLWGIMTAVSWGLG